MVDSSAVVRVLGLLVVLYIVSPAVGAGAGV